MLFLPCQVVGTGFPYSLVLLTSDSIWVLRTSTPKHPPSREAAWNCHQNKIMDSKVNKWCPLHVCLCIYIYIHIIYMYLSLISRRVCTQYTFWRLLLAVRNQATSRTEPLQLPRAVSTRRSSIAPIWSFLVEHKVHLVFHTWPLPVTALPWFLWMW